MVMIVGGLLPSAIWIPRPDLITKVVSLNSSWQIPGLLLSSMICGSKAALMATFAYLTIGLFYLPIFHGGGSIGYLMTPEFGYLVGFIPACLITCKLSQNLKGNKLITLTISAIAGVITIHASGISSFILGSLIYNNSQLSLSEIIISYTLVPLPNQLILCPCISVIVIAVRKLILSR